MARIVIRQMRRDDVDSGFLESLDALSPARDMDPQKARRVFDIIQNNQDHIVAVAVRDKSVVGTATLLIEHKFIHDGSKAGHIEDVAVSAKEQGKGVGRMLIEYLLDVANQHGCYRTTLDCTENLVGFYEKLGLHRHYVCMRINHR